MTRFLVRKSMLLAVSLAFASTGVMAATDANNDYICEAKQSSNSELPVLSRECPIGNGLWGKTPKQKSGLFWIQCGMFSKPVALAQAKSIYSKISTDVWMKPESRGYRCLIGPYDAFDNASQDLKQLKTLKPYRQAFIRAVSKDSDKPATSGKAMAAPVKQQVTKTPPKPKAKPKPVSKPQPKPKAITPKKAAPIPVATTRPNSTAKKTDVGMMVVRRETKIGENYYAIPFLMEGNEQYYMEYGIGWNRLNYEMAMQVCQSQGMRLLNDIEWRALINSGVMTKKQWPIHVPYWGEGKRGLFTSGKITQLTGTSLLNVVCIK